MNLKIGDYVKLKYYSSKEEYNKNKPTNRTYSFDMFKEYYKDLNYKNKIFKIIDAQPAFIDNEILLYRITSENLTHKFHLFEFQLEKVADLKDKFKYILGN